MVIVKSYFQTPEFESLEEAAKIDGSSDISTLFRVILPLSKPIIATLSLFYAVGRWNAYADNMYFIRKKNNLKMIQYLLYRMVASATESQTTALSEAGSVTSTPEVLQAAAVMFVTIPIIIIYPFLQKYFSKGAFTGAIKA
jgi:putative aldouronate transport system permease protein